MFRPRNALVLGAIFATIGVTYFLVQGTGEFIDLQGAVLLACLGVAMAFGFSVLLGGAREL